jgi:hypothetical protein
MLKSWSGRGDSNPRLQLGKLSYYPYTTAAQRRKLNSAPRKRARSGKFGRTRVRRSAPCGSPAYLYSMPAEEGQGRAQGEKGCRSILEHGITRDSPQKGGYQRGHREHKGRRQGEKLQPEQEMAHSHGAPVRLRLIHFGDAGAFDDGGALLTRGELGSLLAVDVDASEFLAVLVKDRDLPMAMLAAAIAVKPRASLPFRTYFSSHLQGSDQKTGVSQLLGSGASPNLITIPSIRTGQDRKLPWKLEQRFSRRFSRDYV